MERRELEEKADKLGVPYRREEREEHIQAKVDARELGLDMRELVRVPECFGLLWDVPQEVECQRCPAAEQCRAVFAHRALVEAETELEAQGEVTPERLSEFLQVSKAAVLVVLAKARGSESRMPEIQPPPPEPVTTELKVVPIGDGDLAKSICPPLTEDPPTETAVETKQGESEESGMAAKKPRAGAKKKRRAQVSPQGARSVVPATAPGMETTTPIAPSAGVLEGRHSRSRKKRAVKPPPKPPKVAKEKRSTSKTTSEGTKVRVKKSKTRYKLEPWGQHTWEARRERERARNKWIRMLTPGMVLRREWDGEIHEVKVRKADYWYRNKAYPTLYAVVKVITGTREAPKQKTAEGKRPKGKRQLCNWSAARFFNLPALLGK